MQDPTLSGHPANHDPNHTVRSDETPATGAEPRSASETYSEPKREDFGDGANETRAEPVDEKGAAIVLQEENEKTISSGLDTNNENPEGDDQEPEDESKYLSGFKLGILSLGLCLTTFVIALDNTIM